ncbi:MAG: phosphoenolpyruvate--protein phosphotransferase [Deltaproteobacteria bacterium]|nr:phosphoenolpyruvate--protein phosphotransferase [Deltaproteobacteria bacterium]
MANTYQDALLEIMNLSSMIHAPDDLKQVLNSLVQKIAKLMSVDACSLYLYSPVNDQITLKATFGLNNELIDHISVKPGQGLTGKTFEQGTPLSIDDARKDQKFIPIAGLGEEQYNAYLAAPLVYNRQAIGVISVQNKVAKKFSKKDTQFLLALAIPAVGLVEKAKFLESVSGFDKKDVTQKSTPHDEAITYQYLKDHILHGIAAVPGITMGHLRVIHHNHGTAGNRIEPQAVKNELEKFKEAIEYVANEIKKTKAQAEEKFGPEEASIFEAYLLFLESTNFQKQVQQEIKTNISAVQAVNHVVQQYMDRMSVAQDDYIKERAYDIQDVARKVVDHLVYGEKHHKDFSVTEDTIFLNEFWSISDFVDLDLKMTKGIVSHNGGASSHIAILADTLNLPTVLGLGSAAAQLRDGDFLIVDGYSGTAIVNPSPSTIQIYKSELAEIEKRRKKFEVNKQQKVSIALKKGARKQISIGANLGMAAHVANAVKSGADHVGLYRTEFPFLVRKSLPTEQEQFEIYQSVLKGMKGKEVTFRTLDIGGDKYVPYLNLPEESNPALGWRAIRFSLERRDLFRIQLRALARASAYGKMKLLFPMVSDLKQIRIVKDEFQMVCKQLKEEGIPFAKKIPLGIMIELPAAVKIAQHLIKEVDFFSIGTNDLVQYCLGVDRTNPLVADLYDPYHPAVIQLIHEAIEKTHKAGKKIYVCGDIASQPKLAALLIGLGIDGLSLIPRNIPKIKYLIRQLKNCDVQKLGRKILKQDSPNCIKKILNECFATPELNAFET